MSVARHTALPKLLPDRRSGQENGIVIKLRGMIWNVASTNQYVPEFPPETIRDEIITPVNERPALLAELVFARRVVEAARVLRAYKRQTLDLSYEQERQLVDNLFAALAAYDKGEGE